MTESGHTLWVPRIEPQGMTWGFSIGVQTRPGRGRIRIRGFATGLSDLHPAPQRPWSDTVGGKIEVGSGSGSITPVT
jgi:hypothetical protein